MLKNEAVPVKTKRPLLNGAWSKRKNVYIHLYNIDTCCTPKYKVNEHINKRKFKVVITSSCQDTYRSPSKKHQGTFNSDFMNAMIPFRISNPLLKAKISFPEQTMRKPANFDQNKTKISNFRQYAFLFQYACFWICILWSNHCRLDIKLQT